jgi:hypothetical protein
LHYFDASSNAKYYLGAGARSGIVWGDRVYAVEASGNFSAGRSFLGKGDGRHFFEVNMLWPNYVRYTESVQVSEFDRKKTFVNLQFVSVGLIYGWMF